MLPQNSPIKLNLTQPRPYPGCQSFFPVVGSEAAIGWRRTDVNLFTRVMETLLTKFAIPQFDNISRPFYTSLPHVQTYQITKTNRSHKKPVWPAILFQNHMEVRFVTAVTRGFFSRSLPDRGSAAVSQPTTGKNPLAPRIPRPRITRRIKWSIGHLHSGVILLLRPEFFSFFLSHLNLVILTRF